MPVYELLGGKTRDKVRVYASVMHLTEDNQKLAEQYQQLQEMGFTAPVTQDMKRLLDQEEL